jgi:phosphomevalonate kinase
MTWQGYQLKLDLISSSTNKFVHLALQNTISLAAEISGIKSVIEKLASGIDIAVIGDNDFYSQREKVHERRSV